MTDYIGKYVKRFESGSVGSLCLSSCGSDWGLSCGSYQLTLRWGNCINFLKRYFPSEAAGLYYKGPDKASKTWPGAEFCSSPEGVKAIWQKCYNKVGADKFFEYEHDWIKQTYYVPVKDKVKSYIDLDTADRGFQECFWSWSVHKGSGGAYTGFKNVLNNNHITNLEFINKEDLFDMIYDYRYSVDKSNRYKKGLKSSERETLRPLIGTGTFSGYTENPTLSDSTVKDTPKTEILYKVQTGAFSVKSNAEKLKEKMYQIGYNSIIVYDNKLYRVQVGAFTKLENAKNLLNKIKSYGYDALIVTIATTDNKEETVYITTPLSGTIKVIYQDNEGINIRSIPSYNESAIDVYHYGTTMKVVGITHDKEFYKLENGLFITTNPKYVQYFKKETVIDLYKVRIKKDNTNIYKNASKVNIVGTVNKNEVFTIVNEANGFGKLKSGVGYLYLSDVKKLV